MSSQESDPPDHVHLLADGRRLGWCEFGPADGPVIVYCHGLPGTRRDCSFDPTALRATGARVIGIDRPGFGLSSPEHGRRSYAGWARDVEHLLDALGIEHVGVVGYSCGGPYALACAAVLPRRVSSVALVGGVATADMPGFLRSLPRADAAMLIAALRTPSLARSGTALALREARRKPHVFRERLDREFPSAADRAALEQEGVREFTRLMFLEAGRGGSAGIVEDFAVWARPSGIRLDQIAAPVTLWHGAEDLAVPLSHAEWFAERIPGAALTVWPGVGHIPPGAAWRDVTAAMTGSG